MFIHWFFFFGTYPASTDNIDPVISDCPTSFTVDAGNNDFVFVFWTAPTATDNSGTVTQVSGPSSNNGFYQAGTVNDVTYIFEDAAGNQAVCSFQVTVTGLYSAFFRFSFSFQNLGI